MRQISRSHNTSKTMGQNGARHVTKREDNGTMLSEALQEIPGIQVFPRDKRVTQRSWHTYNFRFISEEFEGVTRPQFLRAIKAEGLIEKYRAIAYEE